MITEPKVTVVIPSYNRANFISKAIQSVYNQTWPYWKILIVDDASTDHTIKILQPYLDDKRVKLFCHKQNLGISFVLNTALSLVDTKYFLQLDSDDWLEPFAIEKLVQGMEQQPETTAMAYGNEVWWYYDEKNQLIQKKSVRHRHFRDKYKFITYFGSMFHPRFYRTKLLKKIGGWETEGPFSGRYMEDRQMCYRLLEKYCFLWINQTLYNLTKHRQGQLTKGSKPERNLIRRWAIERALYTWGGKYRPVFKRSYGWVMIDHLKNIADDDHLKLPAIAHFDYNGENNHLKPEIFHLPGYRGILFVEKNGKNRRQDDVIKLDHISDLSAYLPKKYIRALQIHQDRWATKLIDIKKRYGIPLITSIRWIDGGLYREEYLGELQKWFEMGDLFLSNSRYLADYLRKQGCPEEKIRVLYQGTDLSRFRFNPKSWSNGENLKILAVGSFQEMKGFHHLIEAFGMVQERFSRTELLLMGAGKMQTEYMNQVDRLALQSKVKILDWVDYRMIHGVYPTAHIFCAPSCTDSEGNQEGIPHSLKEAMATGMPIVSTAHAGIPELVTNGKSGLLVKEGDAKALADKLLWLIEHTETWRSFGQEARKKVESQFSLLKQLEKQEEIYNSLLGL